MAALTTQYPPPLSAPPTVESLEQLLEGLQRPLRRGAQVPAATALASDATRDGPLFDGPLFDEHPSRLHAVALEADDASEPATFSAAVVPTSDAARTEPAPVPTLTASGREAQPGGLSWSAHPGGAGRRRRRVLLAVAAAATTLSAAAAVVDRVL